MRSSAVLCLALGIVAPVAAQDRDTVLVSLDAETAEVVQRLTPAGDSVRAFAMRIAGQSIEMVEVVREGETLLDAGLTFDDRAYALDVVSGAPIRIRYVVQGALDRIPLFVTGGRAELAVVHEIEEPFLLRLTGDPGVLSAIDLPTSLPRFERAESGGLEVALSSLPALVRLSAGGAFSFTRVADMFVLFLIFLGAVFAWRRGRVVRGAGDAGA